MKTLAIVNGRVITPDQVLEKASVIVEGERIAAIHSDYYAPEGAAIINADGLTLVPGFIDVHVHGGGGHDVMDATPEAIGGMAQFFAAHGVTSFLPTTVTAGHKEVLAAVKNITHCQEQYRGGAHILGIHLEGPYISSSHPGAQATKYIRLPEPAEYQQLFAWNNVLLISLAPELAGGKELIKYSRSQGAMVAVGHSGASYDEVIAAVQLGLNQACHTFNGMSGLHHRQPGTVGAALTCDEIYAQIIVDFVHLHPAVVKLLVKAKGTERTILITDSIRAAGLPEGEYDLGGGQGVVVKDGAVCLIHGNSLAGSVLTLDAALRNVMEATRLPLAEALPMATSVPARSLGLAHELGSILPGYIADLVLLNQDLQVQASIVRGNVIYQMNNLT